jgi:hypothetical protein
MAFESNEAAVRVSNWTLATGRICYVVEGSNSRYHNAGGGQQATAGVASADEAVDSSLDHDEAAFLLPACA